MCTEYCDVHLEMKCALGIGMCTEYWDLHRVFGGVFGTCI